MEGSIQPTVTIISLCLAVLSLGGGVAVYIRGYGRMENEIKSILEAIERIEQAQKEIQGPRGTLARFGERIGKLEARFESFRAVIEDRRRRLTPIPTPMPGADEEDDG